MAVVAYRDGRLHCMCGGEEADERKQRGWEAEERKRRRGKIEEE